MAQYYSASPPVVVQGRPYYAQSPYTGSGQQQQQYYVEKPDSAAAYQQQGDFGGQQQLPGGASADNKPTRHRGCRDAIWAILFYAHLAGMAFITVVYTPQVVNGAIENYSNNNNGGGRLLQEEEEGGGDGTSNSSGGYDTTDIDINPAALITMTAIMGALACILSSLALGFMIRFAEGLVKVR
jgi:hypothetical protein